MRVVADTNILVSGFLWGGPPRRIMDAARTNRIELFTTQVLLEEFEEVLYRPKFAERFRRINRSIVQFIGDYEALATLVEPEAIDFTVEDDQDDDAVLSCAAAAHAKAIVSGDHHLLELGSFRGIPILTATQFLRFLSQIEAQNRES